MASSMFAGLKLRRKARPKLSFSQKMQVEALKGQSFALSMPYWTTVRFAFARTGAGPYVYTLSSPNEVLGFSYAVGDTAPTSAGFGASGLTMQLSETNLQTKHETIAGEEVHIKGIGIQPCAGADARLTSYLWRSVCAILAINGGSTRIPLGPLALIPGGGGLTGSGPDDLGTQPLAGGRPQFSNLTNGWPVNRNVMSIPEGFVWRNKSRRDGQFAIILQAAPGRTLAFTTPADEAAAAGVRGYTYPTTASVDVLIWLQGTVKSGRSHLM